MRGLEFITGHMAYNYLNLTEDNHQAGQHLSKKMSLKYVYQITLEH